MNPTIHRLSPVLIGLALVFLSNPAVSNSAPLTKEEELLIETVINVGLDVVLSESDIPGVVVGIMQGDNELYVGGRGIGDLATGAPIDPAHQYHIGSETKTFTGTVVLQLVDEGVIDLDSTLESWLPQLDVPMADQITMRNLLSMTSGVPDYLNSPAADGGPGSLVDQFARENAQSVIDHELLVTNTNGMDRLGPIGSEMHYSNTNFILLGLIAEKASCLTGTCSTMSELINDKIVAPLGLTSTLLPTSIDAFNDPYTHGYINPALILGGPDDPNFDTSVQRPDMPWSAGAMISNVPDQLIYIRQLASNEFRLLSEETQALRIGAIASSPTDGEVAVAPARYGLAIYEFDSALNDSTFIGHSGAINGYTGSIFYQPEHDLYYVVSVNRFPSVDDLSAVNFLWAVDLHLNRILEANGSCSSIDGTTQICSGASVRIDTLEVSDRLILNSSHQTVSGYKFGTDTCGEQSDGTYSCEPVLNTVPTIAAYGHGLTGIHLNSSGGEITVDPGALIEIYGHDSVMIKTSGDSNINLEGDVSAYGVNAHAILGGQGNDVVSVGSKSTVTGRIDLGGGENILHVTGNIEGEVVLDNLTVEGSGVILKAFGAGRLAPTGKLTIGNYQPTKGHQLDINLALSQSPQLTVSAAYLHGGSVNVLSEGLSYDIALDVISGDQITGRFDSIGTNLNRISAVGGYAADTFSVALISPATFDAIASSNLLLVRQYTDAVNRRLMPGLDRNGASSISSTSDDAFWINLYDHRGDWDADGAVSGYEIESRHALFGLDMLELGSMDIGLFLGLGKQEQVVDYSRDESETDVTTLGVYLSSDIGSWVAGTQIAYAKAEGNIERTMTINGLDQQGDAELDHTTRSIFLSLGRDDDLKGWNVNTLLSLGYSSIDFDNYVESGLGEYNLSVDLRDTDHVHSSIMFDIRRTLETEMMGTITPYVSFGIQHQESKASGTYSASLAGFGDSFTINSEVPDGTVRKASVGFHSRLDSSTLSFGIDGEWGSDFSDRGVYLRYLKRI